MLNADAERDLVTSLLRRLPQRTRQAGGDGLGAQARRSIPSISSNVHTHAEKLELVVRKLRAGMMPPAGRARPEPAVYKAMIAWLEDELDRTATPYTPPPGLHRLNRTEYANAIRDLLDLEIDPAKYLPSDDSTHGFDNIAGTLGISSTLVEAYVSAAGKISRLAIGEADAADARRVSHAGGHVAGLSHRGPAVRHARRDARQRTSFRPTASTRVTVTPIFGDNMSPTGFGSVPCEKLEVHARRRAACSCSTGRAAGDSACRHQLRRRPRSCGGRAGPGASRRRRLSRNAVPQDDRPLQDDGRAARGRRDVPADQLRAGARSRSALPARHAPDRTDAGLHVLPARRHGAHRRAVQRHRLRRTRRAAGRCSSAVRRRRRRNGVRAPASSRKLVTRAYPPSGVGRRRRPADEVLPATAARTTTSIEGIEMVLARVLASPKFIYRIETEPANAKLNSRTASPISIWRRACRSSCGAPAPTTS